MLFVVLLTLCCRVCHATMCVIGEQRLKYNRCTLLEINERFKYNNSAEHSLTKELSDLDLLCEPSPDLPAALIPANGRRKRCERTRNHSKRGGVQARLKANPTRPAVPSIILANALKTSQSSKLDQPKYLDVYPEPVLIC